MTPAHRRLALLLLALVTLVLRDGSVPHQHLGPGVFNSDHDACSLATVGGGLVPDRPEANPALIESAAPPVPPLARLALAVPRHSDSRAPPHA